MNNFVRTNKGNRYFKIKANCKAIVLEYQYPPEAIFM